MLALGCELCDILAAAHAQGIIHRDIKPANLFVTDEGRLKVLDFGIARIRDVATHATLTGMMMGTPAFMAPEQAAGEVRAIGPATDVFAVGATMYNLATGRVPHAGDNLQQMLIQRATRQAPSLAHVLPDASPQMLAVIDRALAIDPADRWSGAAAMRDAIRETYRMSFGRLPSALAATMPAPVPLSLRSTPEGVATGRSSTLGPVSATGAALGALRPPPASAASAPGRKRGMVLGAVAVAIAVMSMSLVRTRVRGARVDDSSLGPVPAQAAAAAVLAPPGTSPVPSAASLVLVAPDSTMATDLDAGRASLAVPLDGGRRASPAPATGAPTRSVGKRDCSPPFTVDAAGAHHWKLECL